MTDIDTALGLLQEAVGNEIESANREGAEALRLGKYDQAERQMKKSKELEAFKKQVGALHKAYKNIRSSRKKSPRAQRGSLTPIEAYYGPILQALKEMKGRGNTKQVIDRVGKIMRPKLKDADYGKYSNSDRETIWRNRCRWARTDLVRQGKLKSDSPRGTWELTEP